MKKIYFVRHGATEGTEQGAYQLPTLPLSEKGREQAQFVADRFKSIKIDVIVTSAMTRAEQTAEIIAKEIKKEIVHSEPDFFHEILRPSAVRGKSKQDTGVLAIMEEIKAHFDDPDWHHSDEENFTDLELRAENALAFLSSCKEERILVVTHGNLLNMIMAILSLGEKLTPKLFRRLRNLMILRNTGITLIDEHKGEFFLITWNDHAHLGEVEYNYND